MPVWKYNDKCYLKSNDKTITGYIVDLSNEPPECKIELFGFTKYMPYIMDLTFINMNLKTKTQVKGYTTSKIIQIY